MDRNLQIDINADVGESYADQKVGNDLELMPLISSANIACGFHAGDYNQMQKTIQLALQHGVAIGAHPGYDDLYGFGRQALEIGDQELWNLIIYQLGALQTMAQALTGKVIHVKPHGALYNQAAIDERIANVIINAVKKVMPEVKLFGMAGSVILQKAEQQGIAVRHEYFLDRAYTPEGRLVDRKIPGAVITDVIIAVEKCIDMLTNSKQRIDTICVHGDNPNCIKMVSELRQQLTNAGYTISAK